MAFVDERTYFLDREGQCRRMAAKATDPEARRVHIELAERYAEMARGQPEMTEAAWSMNGQPERAMKGARG